MAAPENPVQLATQSTVIFFITEAILALRANRFDMRKDVMDQKLHFKSEITNPG